MTAVHDDDDDRDDASEQLRTQFLRRVAHDIASPAGVTLTVLDELANADQPRPDLIAMARRSLRRLMRLSEHLALVAELEKNSVQPELEPADVRTVTRQALDDALAIDGRKDILATSELPSVPAIVAADARLLVLVLREIIGNALKLATSRVEVTVTADDERVRVRVDDDGPGFAEDALATLGKRFVRRPVQRGLGLSLSMATEILTSHGGKMAIETSSLPAGRRGTTGAGVVVTLPIMTRS